MTGIEPALSAWEAEVLPLNYIRVSALRLGRQVTALGGHMGKDNRDGAVRKATEGSETAE